MELLIKIGKNYLTKAYQKFIFYRSMKVDEGFSAEHPIGLSFP
jgi:hypothetical protein